MKYTVLNQAFSYSCENTCAFGKDLVLLHHAEDLTRELPWAQNGFTIVPFGHKVLWQKLINHAREQLEYFIKTTLPDTSQSFTIEQYHSFISSQQEHLAVIEQTKLLPVSHFPIDITIFEQHISEICKQPLEVCNPYDGQRIFHYRIIRPNSRDNNPLHRDVWLPDYDNCLNLYIPIAGSNENSSLILAPGSHHWPESRIKKTIGGAIIENVKFNVPAVMAIAGRYELIRANPQENEILIFSPYLIHGGAANINKNTTRISLEIRMWQKKS